MNISVKYLGKETVIQAGKEDIQTIRVKAHKVMLERLIKEGLVNKVKGFYELKEEIDLSKYNDLEIVTDNGKQTNGTLAGVLGGIK